MTASSSAAEEQYFVTEDSKYIGIPWLLYTLDVHHENWTLAVKRHISSVMPSEDY